MNDERYTKHYVKILNNTITETLLRNIQMQAQAEFVDELVGELNNENESLRKQIQELSEQIQEKINQIDQFNIDNSELEKFRYQVHHIDTFRNELEKAREQLKQQQVEFDKKTEEVSKKYTSQIIELNKKIEYLQLTPAKRKKFDEEKAKQNETANVLQVLTDSTATRDGGSF